MKDYFVARVMRRFFVGEGVYLFSYNADTVGKFDNMDGAFYSCDDEKYFSIMDSRSISGDTEYAIYDAMKIGDIIENYKDNNDFNSEKSNYKEVLDYYRKAIKPHIILSKLCDGEVILLELDSDILDNINELEEQTGVLDDVVNEQLETVVANIVSGTYSIENLIELKNTIRDQRENLRGVIEIIDDEISKSENTNNDLDEYDKLGIINIDKLFKQVTKTLVAQDEAALRVITEIASLSMEDNPQNGILITGSPGVGKTKLMSLIAKYINRGFIKIDSTQLSRPGYTGASIEECLWRLYKSCGFDMEKTKHSIVYFDEIDKKGSTDKTDVSGQSVLNVLLKFLDGTVYCACENEQRKTEGTYQDIDTSNMIVIFGGAFVNVYNNLFDKKPIGYGADINNQKYEPSIDDFVKKEQMTREFMRRNPVIIHLDDFSLDAYANLLVHSDESPLIIERNKFKKMEVLLTVKEGFIDAIAHEAYNKKMGASGLVGSIKDFIYEPFREVNSHLGEYSEVILDADEKRGKVYELIRKR